MMRLKPITLGAAMIVALCGAAQPADEPGEAAAAPTSEVAPSEAVPSEAAPSETAAPEALPSEAAPSETAAPEAGSSPASESPSPAAEDAPLPDAAATPPAADAAVPADKPGAPAKGKPPTREYFVGVWAEQGKSCETALDFKADGTLIGPFPRWELSETGELTMVGNRQKIFLTVIDANTMQSRRAPNDPPRILKRCGG